MHTTNHWIAKNVFVGLVLYPTDLLLARALRTPLKSLAAGLLAMALLACPCQAATYSWTGSSGGDWNTAGNWSTAKPGAADVALFNTTLSSVTNASADQSVGTIYFDTNSGTANGTFTIGTTTGNKLLLTNAGSIQILSTLAGTGKTITINSPITLNPANGYNAGSYTFTNNSADSSNTLNFGGSIGGGTTTNSVTLSLAGANTGNNTISGIISNGSAGSVQLAKSGAGTWVFGADNTFTSRLNILGGTLKLASNQTTARELRVGDDTSGGSAALDLAGYSFMAGNGSSAPVWLGASTTAAAGATANIIDSSAGKTGMLKWGFNFTYYAGTAGRNNGQAIISANMDLNFNGGTRAFSVADSDQTTEEVLVTGNTSNSLGSTTLRKDGAGTLILAGANTYGPTNVNGGILQIGNGGTTGSVNSSITITAGTLVFKRSDSIAQGTHFGGALSGAGGLTQAGSGMLTLNLANTYTGATTISAGTLALTGAGALSSAGAVNATASGATFDISGITASSLTIGSLSGSAGSVVTLGSKRLTVGDASSTTFAGGIGGSGGSLTKQGAGSLTLTGTNTFSGATTISAGILSIAGTNGLRGTSGVNIAGGAGLTYTGSADTFNQNITVTSGTGTVANNGTGTLTLGGTLTKNGTVLRLTGGAFNVTGQVVGSNSNSDLIVAGTSSVTLSATSTYNGPTFVIESSTLALNTNNAIPNNSVVTLGDATTQGTLNIGSFTNAIGGLAFGSAGGTLRLAATSTSAASLTAATGTMTLTNGTLDLAGSGSTAGIYRVLSAGTIAGSFANITGTSAAYQVISSATSVDYQQRAVLGTVSVTNPATAIITGGSAAFTYTVGNNALSGGANLSFTGAGLAGVAGSSSGSAAAAAPSGSISGLVFNGTSIGAGQSGTFTVSAPTAFGGTTATGTVSVDVYGHASGSVSGGTIRVADSIVGYSGTLAGLTTASVGNAAGYRVNLKTLGTTSAGGVSINNVSGISAGGSSTISASVLTGTATGANAVNQQFTLTYADDSALAGALSSGLGSGTVTVQGNVYNHASGSAAGTTIALADSIVGYTGSLSGLTSATISNAAGYRVDLMTTGGTSAGFVNINNVSGIAAGSFGMISAAASLDGSQTVGSNALGQVFSLTYADNSALAGASSNLGSQSITVTGNVLDHALPGFVATGITDPRTQTTLDINFGSIDQSAGVQNFSYALTNLASLLYGPDLTAGLDFTGVTGDGNGFTSGLSLFNNLSAGGTSSLFTATFTPSAQGSFSKQFTLSFSDNRNLAGASARRDLTINAQVIVVPEPGALALAGLGIGLAGWSLWNRRPTHHRHAP